MKWFLIFALVFAICQCGIAHFKDDDGPFTCWGDSEEVELADEQVCDGHDDCEWGFDEDVWACARKNGQHVCDNWPHPLVIDNSETCNGVPDCPVSEWSYSNVSSDESKFLCHKDDEFPCDDETVIPRDQRCDGHNNCPVGPWGMWDNRTRDEDLWECKGDDQFVCWEDQSYIDESKVCDGVADCSPSRWSNTTEDELLYHCPEEMTKGKHICWGGEVMVDEDLMCDGNDDCPNEYGMASDENPWDCGDWSGMGSESESEGKENAIFRRNPDKERAFNKFLEMKGINRRSLGRR